MEVQAIPSAFAILDILGYGRLMHRKPREVVTVINEFLQASNRNYPVQKDLDRYASWSGKTKSPAIEYLHFSDSLLIWLSWDESSPDLFKTPEQLLCTVSYATSLMLSYLVSVGIPLRGAIGYGPIYVSKDPLFFTGKELYETMRLERRQAWAGVALHVSAEKIIRYEENNPFWVEYEVPMSDDCAPYPQFAIDWVSPLLASPALIPPWDQMFGSGSDDRVSRKKLETQKFFEELVKQRRSVPLRQHETDIISRRKIFHPLPAS